MVEMGKARHPRSRSERELIAQLSSSVEKALAICDGTGPAEGATDALPLDSRRTSSRY